MRGRCGLHGLGAVNMRAPDMTDYRDLWEEDEIAYNVYTLTDGAIDREESFAAETDPALVWDEFSRQERLAENWNRDNLESGAEFTVHLYDVLSGVMMAEACIPRP